MPKYGSVGVSDTTFVKHQMIDVLLRFLMRVARSNINKLGGQFRIFDLYAGSGTYSKEKNGQLLDSGYRGSPLIAAEIAEKEIPGNWTYTGYEIDNTAAQVLSVNMSKYPERTSVFHGLYQDFLHDHISQISGYAPGVILGDPNALMDYSYLQEVSKLPKLNRIDVVLHIPFTAAKRVAPTDGTLNLDTDCSPLETDLRAINKRHIFISEPQGTNQWTCLVLTNWDRFPNDVWDFRNITTEKGLKRLKRVCLTKEQYDQWLYQYEGNRPLFEGW